jgi:PAS domain S-box-containing protein
MVEIADAEYNKLLGRLRQLETSAREHEKDKEIMALDTGAQKVRAAIAELSVLEIDRAAILNRSFALLGEFLRVDRVCLQILREDEEVAVTDHEWVREGGKPSLGNRFKLQEGGWITRAFMQGETVKIDALHHDNLPLLSRVVMKMGGIKSMLGIPFYQSGKLAGFYSLDDCSRQRVWKDAEVALFKDAARLIEIILERKAVEDSVRESEARYKLLFDSSSDILVHIDDAGRIKDVSRRAEEVSGYRREEVVGKNIAALANLFSKKSIALMVANFVRRKMGFAVGPYEIEGSDNKGRQLVYETRAVLLRNSEGKAMGELAILHDISDCKRMEELLKKQAEGLAYVNQRLAESDRMKSNFLSNVAHEISAPLASIKGFISTIRGDSNMDAAVREDFMRIIEDETDRLSRIIDGLLDLSRMESGRMKFKKSKVQLLDLIRKAVGIVREQAAQKGLQLEMALPDQLPPVYADEEKMLQVIINFLSNSIKYTKEGRVVISVREDGAEVRLEVADTGIGISREDLPRVFEKFQRFETPGIEVKGMGLGLSIVKAMVELQGGKVFVESQVGKGSKFGFILPVVQGAKTV